MFPWKTESRVSGNNRSQGASKLLSCFQAEFQRLALGFKCDMFTLEKRLRLEERSRDLAEENVRREVSSCQGLLQVRLETCDTFQSTWFLKHVKTTRDT